LELPLEQSETRRFVHAPFRVRAWYKEQVETEAEQSSSESSWTPLSLSGLVIQSDEPLEVRLDFRDWDDRFVPSKLVVQALEARGDLEMTLHKPGVPSIVLEFERWADKDTQTVENPGVLIGDDHTLLLRLESDRSQMSIRQLEFILEGQRGVTP